MKLVCRQQDTDATLPGSLDHAVCLLTGRQRMRGQQQWENNQICDNQSHTQYSSHVQRLPFMSKLTRLDDSGNARMVDAGDKQAFAACEFMIDTLKTNAPFWKKESLQNSDRWLTPG